MRPNQFPQATPDFNRIRCNATRIAQQTAVPVIAVIKSNAYGLGSRRVVHALRDVVDGFY